MRSFWSGAEFWWLFGRIRFPFLLFIGGQFEVPYGMMFLRPGRIIENFFLLIQPEPNMALVLSKRTYKPSAPENLTLVNVSLGCNFFYLLLIYCTGTVQYKQYNCCATGMFCCFWRACTLRIRIRIQKGTEYGSSKITMFTTIIIYLFSLLPVPICQSFFFIITTGMQLVVFQNATYFSGGRGMQWHQL